MQVRYSTDLVARGDFAPMAEELERGHVVRFDACPFPLPGDEDLEFLRTELPRHIRRKNVSYHPEAHRVVGVTGEPALVARTQRILTEHATALQQFLQRAIPSLARDWTVGTTSFRPMQEKGRDLKPHASNELVHVDAGAYGATNGDRILRFFVNVNPAEDRVWATKGTFPELYRRIGREAGVVAPLRMDKGPLDHLRSGVLGGLSSIGVPLARVLDSSPYDRAMRRFHNYMKDTPDFQTSPVGHEEIRFAPFEAWMVLTDMVSHACLSGQHAFISTFVLRLESCRVPELAPINILRNGLPAEEPQTV